MLISAHYIESIVKHKRGIIGYHDDQIINLKGYKLKKDFHCPFTDRIGAYVKVKTYNKIKYYDAYFIF